MSDPGPQRHESTLPTVDPYRDAYAKHNIRKNEIPTIKFSRKPRRAERACLPEGLPHSVDNLDDNQATKDIAQTLQGEQQTRQSIDVMEEGELSYMKDSVGLVKEFSSSLVFTDQGDFMEEVVSEVPDEEVVSEVPDEEFISANDHSGSETITLKCSGSNDPSNYIASSDNSIFPLQYASTPSTSVPSTETEVQQIVTSPIKPPCFTQMPTHSRDFNLPRSRLPLYRHDNRMEASPSPYTPIAPPASLSTADSSSSSDGHTKLQAFRDRNPFRNGFIFPSIPQAPVAFSLPPREGNQVNESQKTCDGPDADAGPSIEVTRLDYPPIALPKNCPTNGLAVLHSTLMPGPESAPLNNHSQGVSTTSPMQNTVPAPFNFIPSAQEIEFRAADGRRSVATGAAYSDDEVAPMEGIDYVPSGDIHGEFKEEYNSESEDELGDDRKGKGGCGYQIRRGAEDKASCLKGSHDYQDRKQPPKQTYTPVHLTDAEKNFKLSVRLQVSELFGHRKPFAIKTPSKDQLTAFEKSQKEVDGPSLETFLLDFDGKTVFTPWNQRVALLLAIQFLKEPNSFTNDTVAVQKAFMVCLRSLHRNYQKSRIPLTKDDTIKEQQGKRRSNQSARQRYLRNRREEAAKQYANSSGQMEVFSKLWERMPKEVCSDDEEVSYPNGTRSHEILTPAWRSAEVKTWFRTWDHLAMSMRFGPDGKPSPGRFPHARIEANPVKRDPYATAPPNLPLNFYSNEWYKSLDSIEIQKLSAAPAMHLTFPPEILRTAERYEHVRGRKDKPLGPDDPTLTPI